MHLPGLNGYCAPMESYLRDVVEEPRYTQDLESLRRQFPSLDEIHADLTWELSQHPTAGIPLPFASDFRLYTTTPTKDTHAFHILYTFDENKVYLHSIQSVHLE